MTASTPLVRQWHRTQQLAIQPDGSVLAEFHLDGTEDVKRGVLSFGRPVEAVEPGGLGGGIASEIVFMKGVYHRGPLEAVRTA